MADLDNILIFVKVAQFESISKAAHGVNWVLCVETIGKIRRRRRRQDRG